MSQKVSEKRRIADNPTALSIIIVSWNVRELLLRCLDSLQTELAVSEFSDPEIIVVDNASTDGTMEAIQENYPAVQLMQNRKNVGFAQANNQALENCRGDHILLLNPDTIIGPGSIARLTAFMKGNPKAGAIGPKLLNEDGTVQESCYREPTLLREIWLLFHLDAIHSLDLYQIEKWKQNDPQLVDGLKGACILLRKQVVSKVGLFDEDYFMFSEEVDYCHRIRKAGWEIYWVPGAEIVHLGGQSTKQMANDMFLHLYQGKIKYFRKHHGRLTSWIYKLILFLASAGRLTLTPIALLESPLRRRKHIALAGNYLRLLTTLSRH